MVSNVEKHVRLGRRGVLRTVEVFQTTAWHLWHLQPWVGTLPRGAATMLRMYVWIP